MFHVDKVISDLNGRRRVTKQSRTRLEKTHTRWIFLEINPYITCSSTSTHFFRLAVNWADSKKTWLYILSSQTLFDKHFLRLNAIRRCYRSSPLHSTHLLHLFRSFFSTVFFLFGLQSSFVVFLHFRFLVTRRQSCMCVRIKNVVAISSGVVFFFRV